jgi:hypothetical protein
MLLLFVISAAPVAPPPKPPVELVVFKEGLAGKEVEIVSADENGQEYFPFVCRPELPEVVVTDPPSDTKSERVHKPPRTNPVKSKVSNAKYNRRGNRNK